MTGAPPPQPSPQVPRDDSPLSSGPITGILPASREYARQIGFLTTLKAAGLVVVGIAAAAVMGWERLGSMARAEGRAEAAKLEPRVTSLEMMRSELYDMRKENRAYFEAQRTGIPMTSPPPPLPPPPPAPGGTKDGGP